MTRQREPRQRDLPYMLWLKGLVCVRCAYRGYAVSPCEVAHLKMGIGFHGWREAGVQERSNDRRSTPLCDRCHRTDNDAQHARGERRFWDAMNLCPACLAIKLGAAYDEGACGAAVIWQAVREAQTRVEPPH